MSNLNHILVEKINETMMKAIEILMKEHDSILKMIEITQNIFRKPEGEFNIEHVRNVIDFIKNFADKYHHMKEEDVLFKEMEEYGMPKEGGPIGVMLTEHDQGRFFVKNAAEAVENYQNGDHNAYEIMRNHLLSYCELLTNHIHKENFILYPMAEKILPEACLNNIWQKFEETDNSVNNSEYSGKYLNMVEELSKVYL